MRVLDTRPERESRWRRLRPARTVLTVTAALMVVTGGWLVLRAVVPTDGSPVISDPGFRGGLTVDPLHDDGAGLQPNDVVVAVDGVRVDDWLGDSSPDRPRIRDGAQLTYRVVRDGRDQDVRVSLRRDGLSADRLRDNSGILLAALVVFGLGLFTVYRRPDRPPARALLVLGAGLLSYAVFTTFGYDTADVVGARIVFVVGVVGAVGALTVWSAAAAHLALTFPAPPVALDRRPRLIAAVYVVSFALTAGVQAALLLSGRATLTRFDDLATIAGLVLTVLVLLTLAGLVRTLLRATRDPAARAQGILVASGLTITVVTLFVANLVAGDQKWPAWLAALVVLPVPVTIAIAIVRGEFLGIRAVVNRTLVYGALTAILLAVFAASVAVIGVVVGDTGIASTFLATGVVAVVLAPVRTSLQRGVDRLLYGERGDPVRVLGALGHRLEAAVPAGEVLPAVADTVATTLNFPYVALRTGSGSDACLACERGEPVTETQVLPLVHQGVTVGELVIGARRGERSISAHDQALLADVARQIAASVSAAALLTDLAASRSRLAVAREEERARLRHDLHDRLGPHLVGLSLQLDTLQSRIEDASTADAIGRAHAEATRALDEVRRISRGLRPAELEELGLVEAISAAVVRLTVADDDHSWRASIDAAVQLGPVPADVEAAAYQIALEALSNAYRHSGGHSARVRVGIDADGSELTIEIADDGRGIDHGAPPGVGIQSMHERATSVHGWVQVAAGPVGGTVVRARLPLTDNRE
jgi:signal transduction histidine kinase